MFQFGDVIMNKIEFKPLTYNPQTDEHLVDSRDEFPQVNIMNLLFMNGQVQVSRQQAFIYSGEVEFMFIILKSK